MPPKRVLGYARVSSAEQALGTSLQDQQDAIRSHARSKGLDVATMFVEAESAVHEKIERREQIRSLLSSVRAGDLVLVDKLDRWSRDPEFTYRSVRELLAAGASFFAVGDQCDPSTPEGDTMLGFRVLFAREEHKRIKLRMVGTRKLLRDRGYYVEGLPPWGYRRQNVKGVDRNVLVVNEDEAARVRRAFTLCIAGRSLLQIAEEMGEERDRIRDALRRRVYLGEVLDSRGQWIAGKHPPIVDAATFAEAADALTGRRYGSRSPGEGVETADWWLREIAACGACGAKMRAAYAGPKERRRYYYACSHKCERKWVPVREAEAACEPIVSARLAELVEAISSPKGRERSGPSDEDIGQRRERIARKRERLLDAFSDGHLSRDELRARMGALDEERTKVDAMATRAPEMSREQRHALLASVERITRAWSLASPQIRRQIANTLAKRVRLARGVAPVAEWKTVDALTRELGA